MQEISESACGDNTLDQARFIIHQSTYFNAAEKTAQVPFLDHQMLECDSNGREYTNVDHDITLRVLEGALAEGEKVHFEVAIAMYGPFNFPENAMLISPILWLCLLEEDAKLKKSIEIILPHYLSGNIQKYGIGFMKANHKDYEMDDNCKMHYNFKPLVTDTALTYREGQGYGITVVDHFCYLCLAAQENAPTITENTNYCLARVESICSESLQEFIFCTSYLLPTCTKVILYNVKISSHFISMMIFLQTGTTGAVSTKHHTIFKTIPV